MVDLLYIVECRYGNLFLRLRVYYRIVQSFVSCSHWGLDLARERRMGELGKSETKEVIVVVEEKGG